MNQFTVYFVLILCQSDSWWMVHGNNYARPKSNHKQSLTDQEQLRRTRPEPDMPTDNDTGTIRPPVTGKQTKNDTGTTTLTPDTPTAQVPDRCTGLTCYNGGAVSSDDDACKCLCVDGFSGLLCEYNLEQSEWPSGPYWLLMPVDGCPETKKHGWEIGYIKFTTKEAFNVSDPVTLFDGSTTNISIAFKPYYFQLNFCYKSLDLDSNISWPNSNFAIFGKEYNCPIDFQEMSLAFSLPPLLHVMRDGYIPDIHLEEDTESSKSDIVFTLCVHERSGNEPFKIPMSIESPVLLMKHPASDCTKADGMTQTEEVFFPLQVSYISGNETKLGSVIHCYYIPMKKEPPSLNLEAFDRECKGIFHRTVESKPGECDLAHSFFIFRDIRDCPVDSWIHIDLLQTLSVSGVLFELDVNFSRFHRLFNDIIDVLLDSDADIYVSNVPWNETGVVATRCSYSHVHNSGRNINHLFIYRCSRDIEGRFITLRIRNHTGVNALLEFAEPSNAFTLDVYGISCSKTELITPCTTDLGMETFAIQDFQVTASTSEDNHPPANARPGLNGWEASISEDRPYIQVDLLAITLVNGVVIYNRQDMVKEDDNEFLWTFTPKGLKSFTLKYGTMAHNLIDYNNMEIYTDMAQPIARPQRFLFYKPFLARYVRIYPKSFSSDVTPRLNLEILGCKQFGVPSLSCKDSANTELVNTTQMFAPSYGAVETTTACSTKCMNNLSKCFGFYYYESETSLSCKIIFHHDVSRFDKVQASKVDGAMPVCWDNAFVVKFTNFDLLKTYDFGWGNKLNLPPPASTFINTTGAVISSPGYPFYYPTNMVYTWRIEVQTGWLQVTFTDIFLKEKQSEVDVRTNDGCEEVIYFLNSDRIDKVIKRSRVMDNINNTFNGMRTNVGFAVSEITVLFRSCAAPYYRHQNARGFRAVVRSKDLPSCSSKVFSPFDCLLDNSALEIISNTFNDVPLTSSQIWTINVRSKFLVTRLMFNKFEVSCFSGSTFQIKEMTFCNQGMSILPLEHRVDSSFRIIFTVRTNCEKKQMVEGFNLTYQHIKPHESILAMTPYTPDLPYDQRYNMTTEVCSPKYGKCYTIFKSNNPAFTWNDAVLLCKRFDMMLVSLTLREEMHFVKTFAAFEIKAEPISLYIGLYRFVDAEHVFFEQWINGGPLSFTAWDLAQPEDNFLKTCTVMTCETFESMGKPCVWKTIICEQNLTDFAVCERPYLNETNTYRLNDTYHIKITEPDQNNNGFLEIMTPCSCDISDMYVTWYYRIDNQDYVLMEKVQPGYFFNHDQCNSLCSTGDATTFVTGFYYERLQDGINATIRAEVAHKRFPYLIKTVAFTNIYRILDTRIKVKPGIQSHLFDCGNGERISILARCNGYVECSNAHDEQKCNTTCGDDKFMCPDGRCIHVSQLCDFIQDCVDSSDEYCDYAECNVETSFQCENGHCISRYKRCNAYKDCLDGSDEMNCITCNTTTAFQCRDKTCILKDYFCDKNFDCPDGSDEEDCTEILFKTCDDVWAYGHTESGLYTIHGIEARCEFNKGSTKMTFLHPDWECYGNAGRITIRGVDCETTSTTYVNQSRQIIPDGIQHRKLGGARGGIDLKPKSPIIDAGDSGYLCRQKISKIFRPYERVVREADSVYNASTDTSHLEVDYLYDDSQRYSTFNDWVSSPLREFGVENMQLASLSIDLNKFTYQLDSIVCVKETIRRRDMLSRLSCGDGFTSTSVGKMCIYDLDEQGKLDGCRSMEHLSDCETHACEAEYFKCPNSFCIPHKFVCDGIKHCQNNEDEYGCRWCEMPKGTMLFAGIENKKVLGPEALQSVFRLASQFYSARNGVVLFETIKTTNTNGNVTLNAHVYHAVNSKTIIPCILKTEEDKGFCLANIFKSANATDPYTGLIWLQPMLTAFQRSIDQSPFPDLFTSLEKLWRVIINPLEQYPLKITQSDITDVRVRNFKMLRTIGAGVFSEFCEDPFPTECLEGYRCSYSRACIPLSQLCDEKVDCPHNDDEQMCDFQCPFNCTCEGYAVRCREASYNVITNASDTTRKIDVSYSVYAYGILILEKNLPFLAKLNMSRCNIEKIGDFGKSVNIIELDISYNRISKIQKNAFLLLKRLTKLNLDGNFHLATLESNCFNGIKIAELELRHTRLTSLLPQTFAGLNLKILDISYNKIRTINGFAFEHLKVEHILINEKFITTFDSNLFSGIDDLKLLTTPGYKFCCVKPFNFPEEKCFPQKDEFSSCDDLMRNTTLQALLWTIGLLSLLGNILSMAYRIKYDRQRLKIGYGIFVTNLAVADFLMGVYLMIIATADNIFRDRYIEVEEYWRNSAWCMMAGVISTISSEMSVMLICCITIDRILVIKYPFGTVKFQPLSAKVTVICCWLLASFIAVLPLSGIEYFGTSFYGRSAVCLALPLTRQRTPGWQYSTVVFIGLNFLLFLLIAMGQLLIYGEVKKRAVLKRRMNMARSNDLAVARNLLLLVLTDFLCWFPIGCMGIMALRGNYVPAEVYAWTAILILPINSALNPFLYTFSTVLGKKNFNPDVSEQTRNDFSKDIALAVMDIIPYFSMKACGGQTRMMNLGEHLRDEGMTNYEKLCIVCHMVRCIDQLHSNDLVLRRITADNILIRLKLSNNKVVRMQFEPPTDCDSKLGRAENMYQFASVVRQLFPEL